MKAVDKRRMCPNCRAFITTDDKSALTASSKWGLARLTAALPPTCSGADSARSFHHHADHAGEHRPVYRHGAVRMRGSRGGGFYLDLSAQTLVDFGAKYFGQPEYQGQWWRLITAGFLHGGLMHILMNMWVSVRCRRAGGGDLRHQPVCRLLSV